MSHSEYHTDVDKSDTVSTISAKTCAGPSQKGYSKKSKPALEKIEEEEALAQKFAEENKRLKQLSKESKRRLADIKRKEAEQRLKMLKEQNEALERKKRDKEQYYVHNIRNQIKKEAKQTIKKEKQRPVTRVQKPIACQRGNRAVTANMPTKPAKITKPISNNHGLEEIKMPINENIDHNEDSNKQVNEVRLEDFLMPMGGSNMPKDNIASNLNGLDLDVRGSMQLSKKRLGILNQIPEDSLIKKGDLLDSLDLQIAAIISKPDNDNCQNEENKKIEDSPIKTKPKPKKIANDICKDSLSEEIKEEITPTLEETNKDDWLKESIKVNADKWRKINNQVRKEEPLKKISVIPTKSDPVPVIEPPKSTLIPLGKEEIIKDKVLIKNPIQNYEENDALKDSLNPTIPAPKNLTINDLLPDTKIKQAINKENIEVNQSREMALLFGIQPDSSNHASKNETDPMKVSTFGWVKTDPELMQEMKSLEEKEITFGKASNAKKGQPKLEEIIKPCVNNVEINKKEEKLDKEIPKKNEPIRTAIEKAISSKQKQEPEPKIESKPSKNFESQLSKKTEIINKPIIQNAEDKITVKPLIPQKPIIISEQPQIIEIKQNSEKTIETKPEISVKNEKQLHIPKKPKSQLREENLSQIASKMPKKGGPKSKATTVFTRDEDFNVDEFIIVFF